MEAFKFLSFCQRLKQLIAAANVLVALSSKIASERGIHTMKIVRKHDTPKLWRIFHEKRISSQGLFGARIGRSGMHSSWAQIVPGFEKFSDFFRFLLPQFFFFFQRAAKKTYQYAQKTHHSAKHTKNAPKTLQNAPKPARCGGGV